MKSSPEQVAAASDGLHARVRRFVAGSLGAGASESFDELALSIARYQREHVPPVRRLVDARAVDLDAAVRADAIPAVPADVFRFARVAAHPPEADACVFRTSGTSLGAEARGEHAMRTTSTYEAVALAWAERRLFVPGGALGCASILPSPAVAPSSSLSFMVGAFARALAGPATWHLEAGAIDVEGLAGACRAARAQGRPLLVAGTSFSFVHLLDASPRASLALPTGSRVMQTGGFKGRAREVDPTDLRAGIAALFGVPAASVVAEYGMTELSSQLYEATLTGGDSGSFHAPPWLRVTAVDPVTLEPVAPGEPGIARFVDLANVDSAVAVQTADVVRVRDEGIELLGRAPGAAPRGCSIAIDMILSGEPR